jgi:predicted dehydrogenase
MLRAGVLGAGHLGKIHLRLLKQSSLYQLIGFYDPNPEHAQEAVGEGGYTCFPDMEALIDEVDVVVVVTPTLSHFHCARKAILKGKHVFIEKPIANTVTEAEELISLAKKQGVKGTVGHVERFNPAFLAVKDQVEHPLFIETHRLAEFNPRGTDVPVVLDLMIHDIDIILSLVKADIQRIDASGVAVLSRSPDIANVRIAFTNGCVANLTASRISLKNMRKSRFFQRNAYISIDFLDKKVEVVKMKNAPENPDEFALVLQNAEGEKKQLYFEHPKIIPGNAILSELETFAEAIKHNREPVVTLQQGAEALRVASEIVTILQSQLNSLEK